MKYYINHFYNYNAIEGIYMENMNVKISAIKTKFLIFGKMMKFKHKKNIEEIIVRSYNFTQITMGCVWYWW